MNKIKSPYPVIRKGKDIDMNEQIAAWETEYRIALSTTIDVYTSYSAVSEETRNDFNTIREVIRAYQRLGYLDREEADNLIDEASEMRSAALTELDPDYMEETKSKAKEAI